MSTDDDDRPLTIRDVVALAELEGAPPYPTEDADRELLRLEVKRLRMRVAELERRVAELEHAR